MLLPLHRRKNILLRGLPGSGKTTLIERLIKVLPGPKKGFYTKEVREHGRRIGFKIITLEGRETWLAKRGKGHPQVGKYRVYLEDFERLVVPILRDITPQTLLIIDEIGKMELFSRPFQQAVWAALDSSIPVLATMGYGRLPFLEKLSQRSEAIFLEVSPASREHLVYRTPLEIHRPGLLIALEGIDGAGKSTLGRQLARALRTKGFKVFTTFEPTLGAWGQKIRHHLQRGSKISPKALAELFLRDRIDHVTKIIIPKLSQGNIILCDRYYLSTLAYQGAAGLEIETLKLQNETWAPVPDIVLYLDIAPEKGIERLDQEREIFENLAFLKRVKEIYEKLLAGFVHERVDATQPLEKVLEQSVKRLTPYLELWHKNRKEV